ncbi:hypothetical protein VY88_10545 [Azospirillum thiophilum]|uniref:Uncharacterized protein n=1 Tax=Azospirillum thiophilum TaxID=528244 RepID=A0AAC8ZT00_9PROT|nr:hypothetical protein [Azospirillum thiophilum]ALG69923.1 hypothetical protein AL072_02165 [Azospirillum thiophilum]KJR66391.1 hypothetical protein VY88_10545 [Azospirillum thiophilum]
MRDLLNNITPVNIIPPSAATSDNTAVVSAIVDSLGYGSVTFILLTGSLADADATFSVLVEHGDAANLSDALAVPDELLVGTEALAGFTFADDNKARKVGYVGGKRYQRLTITPTGNASAANLGAVAILGHPVNAPTSNPPA